MKSTAARGIIRRMRPLETEHTVQRLVPALETGTLSRTDAYMLGLYLREDAPAGSMLRDVGDCLAHTERDRGVAWKFSRDFVAHVTDVFRKGGVLKVEVMYEIHALLDEICDVLENFDIDVDRSRARRFARKSADAIAQAVDSTVFSVPGATVTLLANIGQPMVRILREEPITGGAYDWPTGVAVAIPLFYEASDPEDSHPRA